MFIQIYYSTYFGALLFFQFISSEGNNCYWASEEKKIIERVLIVVPQGCHFETRRKKLTIILEFQWDINVSDISVLNANKSKEFFFYS